MDLTSFVRIAISILVVVWIIETAIGILFGLFVMWDAQKDVAAREEANINSGREALARLLVSTSKSFVFAFFVFLLVGLYVLSPLSRIPGWWRGLPVPLGLVIGVTALIYMMIKKHLTRRRVFNHDRDVETARLFAATQVTAENTIAVEENTEAMRDATDALRKRDGEKDG